MVISTISFVTAPFVVVTKLLVVFQIYYLTFHKWNSENKRFIRIQSRIETDTILSSSVIFFKPCIVPSTLILFKEKFD
jgi:hypothetical protein